MDEKELEDWYDEQKEKLEKDQIKALEQNKENEGSPDPKKRKKARSKKELEKEFLEKSEKARKEYQSRYDSIRFSQDFVKKKKKTKSVVLGPFIKFFLILRSIIVALKNFISRFLLHPISFLYSAIKKGIGNITYGSREWYVFHMKDHVFPALWPFLKFFRIHIKRPIQHARDNLKMLSKNALKEATDQGMKALGTLIKHLKAILAVILKWYGAFSKKFSAIMKKVITILKIIFAPLTMLIKLLKKLKKKKED